MKVNKIKKSTFTYLALGIIILSLIIFSINKIQEFRNFKEQHSYNQKVNGIQVTSAVTFSEDKAKDKIYALKVVDKKDTYKFATDFFKRLGKELDSSCSETYDQPVIYSTSDYYFTADKKYKLEVGHNGLTFTYTDSTSYESSQATSVDENTVREALKKYGVIVPKEAVYSVNGGIMHIFKVARVEDGDKIIDGTVYCDYNTDGTIKYLKNDLIEYAATAESEVVSEAEAYQYIKDGNLKFYKDVQDIDIKSIKIDYVSNRMGYYEPIYEFEAVVNGKTIYIPVSAVKSQEIKNYNPQKLEWLKITGHDLGI